MDIEEGDERSFGAVNFQPAYHLKVFKDIHQPWPGDVNVWEDPSDVVGEGPDRSLGKGSFEAG